MLTPGFELNQDEKFVYIYIKTPYIKISEVEYFIEDYQFKFYVKPYFLRLNLPEKIVENGEESASYDVDKGIFTVLLPKLVPGSHFKDLDLLTKLLACPGRTKIGAPVIEVLSEDHTSKEGGEDELSFDWEWDQEICDEEKVHELSTSGMKYGFGNQKSGVFYLLKDELKEIVENPNPDEFSHSERRLARITAEDVKFDVEYYLADYFDGERIQEVLNYVAQGEEKVSLTEEEKAKLRQLPNKEYLLNDKEELCVFFSLVDIIFAFAYNKRTTLGENTVESAWTISKLSATLSWFESFTNLKDVLVACCRRSLAYPLYRHWELSCKVMEDVKGIFRFGRRKILQCLLEILTLFNGSEPRYLLNELYITDYCIWIQKVKEKKVESLAKKLSEMTKITKDDLGWDLDNMESAALMVHEEQTEETSQSDTESSSSEQSSDTEDETTCDDDESDTLESLVELKDCKVSSEVSGCVTRCGTNDELRSCHEEKGILDAAREKCSDDLSIGDVEILPSLLFGKSRDSGARTLIEVLRDEEDEMGHKDGCRGRVCSGHVEGEIGDDERLHDGDGRTDKDKNYDDDEDLCTVDDDLKKDDDDDKDKDDADYDLSKNADDLKDDNDDHEYNDLHKDDADYDLRKNADDHDKYDNNLKKTNDEDNGDSHQDNHSLHQDDQRSDNKGKFTAKDENNDDLKRADTQDMVNEHDLTGKILDLYINDNDR